MVPRLEVKQALRARCNCDGEQARQGMPSPMPRRISLRSTHLTLASFGQAFGIVGGQYFDDKIVESLGALVGLRDFLFQCREICKIVRAKATT